MTHKQQLQSIAAQLLDAATAGIANPSTSYEKENFEQLEKLAHEMAAFIETMEDMPIAPLNAPTLSEPSPIAVGDAAVINTDGEILLIQRGDNALWALPGGGLEVGESAAAGCIREALEEAGIAAEPIAFVGVHDSRGWYEKANFHMHHQLFLCRPLNNGEPLSPILHAEEVLDVSWYREDALPAALDKLHRKRIHEAFRVWHGDSRADFDKLTVPMQSIDTNAALKKREE